MMLFLSRYLVASVILSLCHAGWSAAIAKDTVPFRCDGPTREEFLQNRYSLEEAALEAIAHHRSDPGRCYLQQIANMLWMDTRNIYTRKTGLEAPTCRFQCPHCAFVFDDYIQSILHKCR